MRLENLKLYLKALKNPPEWSACERRLLAWALCFDGWIDDTDGECGVECTNKGLMDDLYSVAKIGVYAPNRGNFRWRVSATRELLYLLAAVYPYLPSKRARARRLLRKCAERVNREDCNKNKL